MQWIIDNIYIVAGIAFFILSALGKMGKGSGESKPSQMPTFGGGDDPTRRGPRQAKTEQSGQQLRRVQPRPATTASADSVGNRSYENTDNKQTRGVNPYAQEKEIYYEPSSDMESRMDLFSDVDDPHEERDSMEKRKRNMQAELDQIHKHLDRMTSHIPETILEVTDTDVATKKQQSMFAKQALNGVIWAEILGPPRSKKPMGRK